MVIGYYYEIVPHSLGQCELRSYTSLLQDRGTTKVNYVTIGSFAFVLTSRFYSKRILSFLSQKYYLN